ncbi:MAG: hypothetical protein IKC02_01705 [Oscillospiraceae bacterium]|nr:hypothetical protein [Oscillospiraceae bacterium]
MKNKTLKRDLITLLILSVFFVAAMFVFSCYTSPLYPNYFGWDSAIFSLLGKGMLAGKELYTELFDHKGPVIFAIDALGHFIGGRSGIFVLQCLSGIITLCFLYFTGKMLRPKGDYKWAIEAVFLLLCTGGVLFYTMESGNLTEEYSLPFISCACYFFAKYAINAKDDPKHPKAWAVVYGAAFAVLSLLRLNNAITVMAGVFAILVYLIYRKQYINLLWNLLFGLIGILIVYIPTFTYFYLNSSLNEMIYATFNHNFIIVGNTGHVPVLHSPKTFVILYFPMLVSFLLIGLKIIRERKFECVDWILLFILVMNTLNLWVANRFLHYFEIFVPVYCVILCRYISFKPRSLVMWLTLLFTLYYSYSAVQYTLPKYEEVHVQGNTRYTCVAEDMAKIPEEERDSVIGYEIMAMDYMAGDIVPCYKYYTLQSTWAITTPHILPDFMNYVKTEKPLWVLTAVEETGTDLDSILQDAYTLQFENPYVYFYRLAD